MEGSGIRTLEDLKGKSFAFADKDTAFGDYLPKAELVKAGLRAEDFKSLTHLRSSEVIDAVRKGILDAGVAEQEDLDNVPILLKALEKYSDTIQLGRTNLVFLKPLQCPSPPWLTTTSLNSQTANTIATLLQFFHKSGIVIPFDPKLTGFESVLPSDYDMLARDIQAAGEFDRPR
jgi:ABC-type phosphate/phosphonate transport system substrate-binding protein